MSLSRRKGGRGAGAQGLIKYESKMLLELFWGIRRQILRCLIKLDIGEKEGKVMKYWAGRGCFCSFDWSGHILLNFLSDKRMHVLRSRHLSMVERMTGARECNGSCEQLLFHQYIPLQHANVCLTYKFFQ